MASAVSADRRLDVTSILYYVAAFAVVLACLDSTLVWRLAIAQFGHSAALLPAALALALIALALAGTYVRRQYRSAIRWLPLGLGMLIGALALLASDPDLPAKGAHVPEFVVVAILVRRGLARCLGGWPLLGFVTLATLLLGVHDELIQGLWPPRTFGNDDIAMDGVAGLAGGLIAQGIGRGGPVGDVRPAVDVTVLLSAAAPAVGLALMLAALPSFRHAPIPWWTTLPLLAGGLACLLTRVDARLPPDWLRGWALVMTLALTSAVYPLLQRALDLPFY